MSSIMDVIRPELSKLSALELENLPYLICLHSSICKYKPFSTKLGHNIYDYKISDEFYYGYKLASLKKKPGEVSISIFKYFIGFKF